jgi:N-glycosylase/DNA lyase
MDKYKEIKENYKKQKLIILERLKEFKKIWDTKDNEKIFAEMCFCILTPQSRAKLCWDAILNLKEKGILYKGSEKQIEKCLNGVRFKRNKSRYIAIARGLFNEIKRVLEKGKDINEIRNWLVKNVKGFGYKEASHFLRNIGLGEDIAILDRHILKNLKKFGVIREIPKYLTKKNYLKIEDKMKMFSRRMNIPISHLDFLFWSKETGEIFK